MRKVLVVFAVLFVLLGLGAPYGMGIVVEKQLTRLVAQVSALPNVKASLTDYQRGWFSSSAKVVLTLSKAHASGPLSGNAMPDEIQLTLQESIKHGPVLNTPLGLRLGRAFVQSQLDLNPAVQAKLDKVFSEQTNKPQVNSYLLLNFSGSVDSTLAIPHFAFQQPNNGGLFTWKGLEATLHLSRDHKAVSGEVKFAGASLKTADTTMQTSNMDLIYNKNESRGGIWVGKATLTFPSLVVTRSGQDIMRLKDFSSLTTSDVRNQLFESSMDMRLAKLNLEGTAYGPGEMVMTVKNLDAIVLAKLKKQLDTMNQNPNLKPQERQVLMMSLMPKIPAVFDKGAVLAIEKFNVLFPEGPLDMRFKADMQQASTPLSIANFKQRLNMIVDVMLPVGLLEKSLQHMTFKTLTHQQTMTRIAAKQPTTNGNNGAQTKPVLLTDAQLQQAAQQKTQQQIKQWVAEGILIQEGTNYKLQATFSKGVFLVNGKPLPGKKTNQT